MTGTVNFEIHYYSQDELAVKFVADAENEEAQKFGKLLAFSCHTLRQMVCLGYDRVSDSLAAVLREMRHKTVWTMGLANEFGKARVVPYRGSPGKKNFTANLSFSGDNASRVSFILDTQGFGILGRGLGYYSPTSVVGLLIYMAREHQTDSGDLTVSH